MIEKRFFVAPIIKNGKPCLLIRRSFQNEKEIKDIIKTILEEKQIEIKAVVVLRDPFTAKMRLKKLNLID